MNIAANDGPAAPLRVARLVEPFGLLVAQLAYVQETYGGPEVGYRFFAAGGPR